MPRCSVSYAKVLQFLPKAKNRHSVTCKNLLTKLHLRLKRCKPPFFGVQPNNQLNTEHQSLITNYSRWLLNAVSMALECRFVGCWSRKRRQVKPSALKTWHIPQRRCFATLLQYYIITLSIFQVCGKECILIVYNNI